MIQNIPLVGRIVMGLLAGFTLGVAHFGTLAANVRLITREASWRAYALQILRIGMTVLVFLALARLGASMLLGAGVGFLVARSASLAHTGNQS